MKKFISMVMAAAMVVSLVPATAFAATGRVYADGVAQVIGELEKEEDFSVNKVEGLVPAAEAPEVQIELDDVFAEKTASSTDKGAYSFDVTFTLENAEFSDSKGVKVEDREATAHLVFNDLIEVVSTAVEGTDYEIVLGDWDNESVTYTIQSLADATVMLKAGDMIIFDLCSVVDNTNPGDVATVSVESDIIGADAEDLVYVEILDSGIETTVKEAVELGEEAEMLIDEKIEIESNIDKFVAGQKVELTLSSGFEFVKGAKLADWDVDGRKATFTLTEDLLNKAADTITIPKNTITIEAVSAKADAECKLTVEVEEALWNSDDKDYTTKGGFEAKAEAVVLAVVLAEGIIVSVDEDEDVPVMYSGVNTLETGLTSGEDHKSLLVTVEESVVDAWDFKQAFEMTLPEGVFVVSVDDIKATNVTGWNGAKVDPAAAFAEAYVDGGQENVFEFGRKTFDAVDDKKAEIEFALTLVAEPGFEGDVTLEVAGQEVVIATFVAPYTVEAAQNDLVIDYRYTEVPTDVVIKEAEAGLWADKAWFGLGVEKMEMEDDPEVAVNEESEMEIDVDGMGFEVDEESDDEAAVVTISGIELYMSRDLAAGAYDLYLNNTMVDAYVNQSLLNDGTKDAETVIAGVTDVDTWKTYDENNNFVDYAAEYVVKEGFVNVITAGRDQDDASFTKKVVVPVGESYIIAGEETVALDVPAYINAAGYTMLPVRAVATALGINNNNVIWSQTAKQVTILYGQRIITMTAGQSVVYVNGSAIPAAAAVEIVDGRAFLALRDLANALGVTTIAWDPATQTATLN